MKTLIRIIATLVLVAAWAVSAKAKNNDTTDFIVNGVILKSNKKTEGKCRLELYNENTLVESSEIKMNKPFERKLKKNVWYTIRITKEGYQPLLISLNTTLENDSKVLDNLFEFETALIDNETARFMDKDQLEFPVGLVTYNKDNQKFEARDIYTSNHMTSLYKTLPSDNSDVVTNYSVQKQVPVTSTPDIAGEYVIHKNKVLEGWC
jgi:hypothetical protein